MSRDERRMRRQAQRETRILKCTVIYGATCTLWTDDPADLVTTPSGIPICKYCGGVFYQMSLRDWWTRAREYASKNEAPVYIEFIAWLKNKCFKSPQAAAEAFDKQHQG